MAERWLNKDEWIDWEFKIAKPGTFDVVIVTSEQKYGRDWEGGHVVSLDVAGRQLKATVENNGKQEDPANPYWPYVISKMGSVTVDEAGKYNLTVKPESIKGEKKLGFTLVSVKFIPKAMKSLAPFCTRILLLSAFVYTATAQTPPRTFLVDAKTLAEAKHSIASGDKAYALVLEKLENDAQKALRAGTFSVVTKSVTPPSGDKHDYMSKAPYFWPDPKSPDGLPYIRRDGERNPEINKISDHRSMDQMIGAVQTLALVYYFKGDAVYATKAAEILRAWFLDPATRMNPNLQYAQGIPGINTGRGIGLIETRGLARVVDSIGLLEGSKALTDADKQGLKVWFGTFLTWMQASKNGAMKLLLKTITELITMCKPPRSLFFLGKKIWRNELLKWQNKSGLRCKLGRTDGRLWS